MSARRSLLWPVSLTPNRIRQLWYFPLLAMAMGLMMVRMLLMARILEIRSFAEFSGGILISSSFCMLGCLGLQITLQRGWPVNIWRGQELRGLTRAAQCNLAAGGTAVAFIALVLCGLSIGTFSPLLLIVGIVHGCTQQIFLIATVESRSRGDAVRFSRDNIIRALALLSFGILVAVLTGSGIAVLVAEAVLTLSFSVVLLRRSATYARLDMWRLYNLALRRMPRAPWRAAMTLMAITGVAFLLVNLDRWLAAARLSALEFAAYSFAWTVLMLAQSAQQIINTSIYPMMCRRFASNEPRRAFRVCMASSLFVLFAGGIAALPAYVVLKYCVYNWFPKYAGAVVVVPLFLAVAVLRVSDFWSSFVLAAGRENVLLFANTASVITGILLWSLWIYFPTGKALQPTDAALLALILSILSYTTVVGCAWATRLGQGKSRAYV
jgi:O-antigen/teichoic acid export membrane protein